MEVCPLSDEQLKPRTKSLPINKSQQAEDAFIINLCHASDWKERLLGRWVIKQDHLYFEEGLLVPALISGLPIVIQNGLWNNPSFSHFWKQAQTLGYIESHGRKISIANAKFARDDNYDWSLLNKNVQWNLGMKIGLDILNPTQFSEYFTRYQCDNQTKSLDTLSGLIKENKNKILAVNVTRSLNEDEWGAILTECNKHNVILQCHCALSVKLPEVLDVHWLSEDVHLSKPYDFLTTSSGVIHSSSKANPI